MPFGGKKIVVHLFHFDNGLNLFIFIHEEYSVLVSCNLYMHLGFSSLLFLISNILLTTLSLSCLTLQIFFLVFHNPDFFLHVCALVQYGKDYEFEAPVKLLDKLLHSMPQSPDEQLVVVSQVLFLPACLPVFLSMSVLVFTFNVIF